MKINIQGYPSLPLETPTALTFAFSSHPSDSQITIPYPPTESSKMSTDRVQRTTKSMLFASRKRYEPFLISPSALSSKFTRGSPIYVFETENKGALHVITYLGGFIVTSSLTILRDLAKPFFCPVVAMPVITSVEAIVLLSFANMIAPGEKKPIGTDRESERRKAAESSVSSTPRSAFSLWSQSSASDQPVPFGLSNNNNSVVPPLPKGIIVQSDDSSYGTYEGENEDLETSSEAFQNLLLSQYQAPDVETAMADFDKDRESFLYDSYGERKRVRFSQRKKISKFFVDDVVTFKLWFTAEVMISFFWVAEPMTLYYEEAKKTSKKFYLVGDTLWEEKKVDSSVTDNEHQTFLIRLMNLKTTDALDTFRAHLERFVEDKSTGDLSYLLRILTKTGEFADLSTARVRQQTKRFRKNADKKTFKEVVNKAGLFKFYEEEFKVRDPFDVYRVLEQDRKDRRKDLYKGYYKDKDGNQSREEVVIFKNVQQYRTSGWIY